jgi:hypothetical protein
VNAADLQTQRDWFTSQNLVAAARGDLTPAIDTQFVDSAISQLGPYR